MIYQSTLKNYRETLLLPPCKLKSDKNKDVLIFTVQVIFEERYKETYMGQYFYMFSKGFKEKNNKDAKNTMKKPKNS